MLVTFDLLSLLYADSSFSIADRLRHVTLPCRIALPDF